MLFKEEESFSRCYCQDTAWAPQAEIKQGLWEVWLGVPGETSQGHSGVFMPLLVSFGFAFCSADTEHH